MWNELANLNVDPNKVWFLLGDFNDITTMTDQQGGSQLYVNLSSPSKTN